MALGATLAKPQSPTKKTWGRVRRLIKGSGYLLQEVNLNGKDSFPTFVTSEAEEAHVTLLEGDLSIQVDDRTMISPEFCSRLTIPSGHTVMIFNPRMRVSKFILLRNKRSDPNDA